MKQPYVEFHLHSNFSFLEGASHIEELVLRARELGYEALALTDHDGLYTTSWDSTKQRRSDWETKPQTSRRTQRKAPSISTSGWCDSWAVLFSHPADFTPVCTTELGMVARLKQEFDKRNVKVVGLSVDPLFRHDMWARDIAETQGVELNFPLLADAGTEKSRSCMT